MTPDEENELLTRVRVAEEAMRYFAQHIGRIEEALCQLQGTAESQIAVQRKMLAAAGTPESQLDVLFDRKLREPYVAIARQKIGLADQAPPKRETGPEQFPN